MNMTYRKFLAALWLAFLSFFAGSSSWAQFPNDATFTTLSLAPFGTEGLTGDKNGNLYTGGNAGTNCPIWRTSINSPSATLSNSNVIGTISGSCNPLGIALNRDGDVFVANGATGEIYTFVPNTVSPPAATLFASGVPGANGIAFDKRDNLWVSDGTANQGRVWRITGSVANCATAVNCAEVFRIQPQRNGTDLGGLINVSAGFPGAAEPTQGVGSQRRNFPAPAVGGNVQDLVANGLAFSKSGDLFIADTARGAIWRVELDSQGNLKSGQTGCDETFTLNTLCLDNVFVAHPLLEGADGIALDNSENIYVAANERNAVVGVRRSSKEVIEIFRNPVNSAGLRSSAADNSRVLEFPTSPFLLGNRFCISSSDNPRRDNLPNTAGEINNNAGAALRGKISCIDQRLKTPGLALPIR